MRDVSILAGVVGGFHLRGQASDHLPLSLTLVRRDARRPQRRIPMTVASSQIFQEIMRDTCEDHTYRQPRPTPSQFNRAGAPCFASHATHASRDRRVLAAVARRGRLARLLLLVPWPHSLGLVVRRCCAAHPRHGPRRRLAGPPRVLQEAHGGTHSSGDGILGRELCAGGSQGCTTRPTGSTPCRRARATTPMRRFDVVPT